MIRNHQLVASVARNLNCVGVDELLDYWRGPAQDGADERPGGGGVVHRDPQAAAGRSAHQGARGRQQGETDRARGEQGAHNLNPLGLVLIILNPLSWASSYASIPFTWRILSAFLPA